MRPNLERWTLELLDSLAENVGRTLCEPAWQKQSLSAVKYVCSDGDYSAGWKLIGTAMILLGLALTWATLGRRRSAA